MASDLYFTAQVQGTGGGGGAGCVGRKKSREKQLVSTVVASLLFIGGHEQKGTSNIAVDITDSENNNLQMILGMFLLRQCPKS